MNNYNNDLFIKIRGFSWTDDEKDIIEFFKNEKIKTNRIIIPFKNGKNIGEAFIEFETIEDAKNALKRHKEFLHNRYMEVYQSNYDEFSKNEDMVDYNNNKSISGGKSDYKQPPINIRAQPYYPQPLRPYSPNKIDNSHSFIVRLRGVSYSATPQDITHFFSPLVVDNKDVTIVLTREGKPSGGVFVSFKSEAEVRQALLKNKENFMGRMIELFRSSQSELQNAIKQNEDTLAKNITLKPGESSIIKLRGLPYTARENDIVDFFKRSGVIITEKHVHIAHTSDRRPSGIAFVEFLSGEDTARAMVCDREKIGHRYIELFHSTHQEMINQCGPIETLGSDGYKDDYHNIPQPYYYQQPPPPPYYYYPPPQNYNNKYPPPTNYDNKYSSYQPPPNYNNPYPPQNYNSKYPPHREYDRYYRY